MSSTPNQATHDFYFGPDIYLTLNTPYSHMLTLTHILYELYTYEQINVDSNDKFCIYNNKIRSSLAISIYIEMNKFKPFQI